LGNTGDEALSGLSNLSALSDLEGRTGFRLSMVQPQGRETRSKRANPAFTVRDKQCDLIISGLSARQGI
jgi:hypothetical protein